MVSYTEYIGWVAKSNQDWLKFSSGNTAGEKAGFVTLSRNQRILTVADEGGNKVENFDILFDIDANLSVIERTGTVTITQNYNASPDGTKTITVVQSGATIERAEFTPVDEYNIIESDNGLTFYLSLTNGHRKSFIPSILAQEALDSSLDAGGTVSPILPDNPLIGPDNGKQTAEASNDSIDDYMNNRYTFDDSPITPGYGALRAKLSCDINFIANVKFIYEGGIESPDDLYFWYKGKQIPEPGEEHMWRPIWYRAYYKDIEGERKYYAYDEPLNYNDVEDRALLNAINTATWKSGRTEVLMSAATKDSSDSILSNFVWAKKTDEEWVHLSASTTLEYGYYTYEYNSAHTEVDTAVTFISRDITIGIKDTGSPKHWSGDTKELERLTQPANEFIPSYVSTGPVKTVAYLQNPESSGTIPSDGDFYVGSCPGAVGSYALIVRQLKYPSTPFVWFKRTVSGGIVEYPINLSTGENTRGSVTRRFNALNLSLELTTKNRLIQYGMKCNDISGGTADVTYTAKATMNGKQITTIPYSGGDVTVEFDYVVKKDYKVCDNYVYTVEESGSCNTGVISISANTSPNPISHEFSADDGIQLEVLPGRPACTDRIYFTCTATFMQEANTQKYVLESTPENAIFSIGSLPSVDESDDTRKIELNITSELQN